MDLNRILHFITIAECSSYTKAGQKLGLSKSSLSKSLSALEEDLQVRLINRSTRKLSLTHAGKQFFKSSLPLITSLQNAQSKITEFSDEVKGDLRVTMPYEVGAIFLSKVLSLFIARYPSINFEFDFSHQNKDLIEEGFDLAIRVGELEDSSYIAKKLVSSAVGMYASPGYLQRHGEPKSLADLEGHENILSLRAQQLLHTNSEDLLFFNKKSKLVSSSLLFNKKMCILGLGIASIPNTFCVQEVKEGSLVKVLPNYEVFNANIYLVYPSRVHTSKALIAFNDFLIEQASSFQFNAL